VIVTRLHGIRAVIDTIPTGFGPTILAGELRDNDDKPLPPVYPGKTGEQMWSPLSVAPNTPRGLAALLDALQGLAECIPARAVR
jgi:hypothetical protein